jgi:uncharacterized MnhB-related membrane protein
VIGHGKSAALVLLFWLIAALLVIELHRMLAASSPVTCVVAQTLAILAAAFAYMKFGAADASVDHALFAGTAWLVLAILTELIMTAHDHHAWFEITGSPASALRNVLMFAWIAAPALFARRYE